jgi:ParB family transcriptional regulator, chromosome partitioning protein
MVSARCRHPAGTGLSVGAGTSLNEDDLLWAERDEVEAKLDAVQEAARSYDKKLVPHAGAVVAVDRDGRPVVTRGLIKRADLKAIAKLRAKARPNGDAGDAGEEGSPDSGTAETDGPRLTKALVERLTEARTRGLRAALAGNAHIALALMVYVLMRQSADRAEVPGVAIVSRPIGFDDDDAFEQARTAFAERAPEDETALLGACLGQSVEQLLEALAVFMSETVDLTHRGLLREDQRLQRMADCLAAALDLDMTRHWGATEDFWQAAPKALAIAALETAPSVASLGEEERRGMIAAFGKMKKAELARTAAQALKDTGWLPEILITPTREGAFAVTAEGESALSKGDTQAA